MTALPNPSLMANDPSAHQSRMIVMSCKMRTAVILVLSSLFGCAAGPVFTGKSATEGSLRPEVLKIAEPYAKIGTGCRGPVEMVHTEMVAFSPNPESNAKGQLTSGEFTERWTLTFCDRQKAVYVNVRNLPEGRSYFTVSATPPEKK